MGDVDAENVRKLLAAEDYVAGPGLVAAAVLGRRLGKPVFLEGEPGVGKSTFAKAMARVLGATEFVRLQCHSGLDASQALYDWDFPRQVLTLRGAFEGRDVPVDSLYRPEFLVRRPILRAFEHPCAVLLIDEVDRADDEFEACLLEVLESRTVSIPELRPEPGSALTMHMPFVVLTSNQTREVHDALKRRCIYHWIEHPDRDREVEILQRRADGLTQRLAEEIADAIDLARAVVGFGAATLTPEAAEFCAGTVAKQRDDIETIRRLLASPPGDAS
jgi:MoxR-like ATPase